MTMIVPNFDVAVVVQFMYELGIEPSFWAESPLAQKGAEK